MTPSSSENRLLAFALTARDPLGKVEEAGFWLEAYRQSIEGDPVRVFDVVNQLDELVQPNRLDLMREYLDSGGRMQTYREHRIWQAVVRYARELAAGYESCLRLFQAGAPGAAGLEPMVPVVAARTLRALTLDLRWALLRYTAVDASVWGRMGVLYAFSDRLGFATARLKVYPGMTGDSTVRREYLRALVLAVSGMGNLLPPSQVVAERVIAAVAEFFLLHRKPATGCHFGVALREDRPPYRVGEGIVPARGVRFFGPGDAGVMVDRFLRQTVESRIVPPELALSEGFDPSMVADVLRHLSRQWGPKPPVRSERRQRVLATMHVAHGFDNVLDAVGAEPGDPWLDEVTEAWTVENESTAGFGAVLPVREADWLAVGTLVAAKPTWPASWSVGVIRRVSSKSPTLRSVGVQLLARGGVSVQLFPLDSDGWARSLNAILLPTETQTSLAGGEVALVLPKGTTVGLLSCEMRVHDKPYVLTRRRVTDIGEDFEIARFSLRTA
jgi:hypothetical protein